MIFIFANAGGVAPPKQYQRALEDNDVRHVLFSYYYLLRWPEDWVLHYLATGETMPGVPR